MNLKHSPSDLVSFYSSPYESLIKKYIKHVDNLYAKEDPEDPFSQIISSKGEDHERLILDEFFKNMNVVSIEKSDIDSMKKQTIDSMRKGVDVIYQGSLSNESFYGRPDFLIKNNTKSKLGDYSYEIWDAKLSRSIKPEHIIQLCCYSDMVFEITQSLPEKALIITGDKNKEVIRLNDYFSFYTLVKESFLKIHNTKLTSPPNPSEYTNWGKFSDHAAMALKEQDALHQIADIKNSQIHKLNDVEIFTLSDLLKDDAKKPLKMEQKVFDRIKRQAKLQKTSDADEKIR